MADIDVKRLRAIVERNEKADRDEAVALYGVLCDSLPTLLDVYEAWQGADRAALLYDDVAEAMIVVEPEKRPSAKHIVRLVPEGEGT